MKWLQQYLGATYSNIYQPEIMTKTPATFPTITMDTGDKRPKTDVEMTYLEKNNINDSIRLKKYEEKFIWNQHAQDIQSHHGS